MNFKTDTILAQNIMDSMQKTFRKMNKDKIQISLDISFNTSNTLNCLSQTIIMYADIANRINKPELTKMLMNKCSSS